MISVALYYAALGDAAMAATIAGGFTILNTALTGILLRWVHQGRRKLTDTASSAAAAALAAASASEAAADAARVSKDVGRAIRHTDPLIIARPEAPETEPRE